MAETGAARGIFGKWRAVLPSFLAVGGFYAMLFALGITCPIQWLTGVSCPSCGMTRAWLSALRLDFSGAFACHPLFPLVPVTIAAFLGRRRCPRLFRSCAVLAAVAMLAIYAWRMAEPDCAIVTFHPREGMLARVVSSLFDTAREIFTKGV